MSVQSDIETVRQAVEDSLGGQRILARAALDRIASSHKAAMDALEEIDGHLFEKQDASRCRELARAALARGREGR